MPAPLGHDGSCWSAQDSQNSVGRASINPDAGENLPAALSNWADQTFKRSLLCFGLWIWNGVNGEKEGGLFGWLDWAGWWVGVAL